MIRTRDYLGRLLLRAGHALRDPEIRNAEMVAKFNAEYEKRRPFIDRLIQEAGNDDDTVSA